MSSIHDQLKQRRKELGFKQEDMLMRVGMPRQQYQRLESNGNPRLDNLELVAKGLKMEVMLIPQEKLQAVKAILNGKDSPDNRTNQVQSETNALADNPWLDVFGEED
ncbi:MAG: XRE family transcriptional regulator [Methylococcaceae bacterium]|jgi:transcriptional regulator with XRE-family HTH domain|nr:XRE family transcriptional regulator [Methylococcaceae bacterium]